MDVQMPEMDGWVVVQGKLGGGHAFFLLCTWFRV
jgi:hypothetical protein